MTNATMRIFGLVCVIGLLCSLSKAVVGIEDAFAWYELDAASSGSCTNLEIVDSNGPYYYTTSNVGATPPTWTTASATGPGGRETDEMALRTTGSTFAVRLLATNTGSLNSFLTELYGTNVDGADSGSMSMWTRVYIDSNTYAWDAPISLISNANDTKGVVFRFIGSNSGNVRLNVQLRDGSATVASLYDNSLSTDSGAWVDAAFSYDADTKIVLLGIYDADGFDAVEFQLDETFDVVCPGLTGANVYVGADKTAGNVFPGNVESFAMWNTALTAYEMKALSLVPVDILQGDANGDGMVTAGDYASVCSHFGDMGDPGIPGDANYDGVVSAGDYASVQSNFGSTSGGQILPESATMSLVIVGGLSLIRRRKN